MTMSLGDNKLHPLQIEDARDAAFQASVMQKAVEDDMRVAGRQLAECERLYRLALTVEIKRLHDGGVAWTTCETMAKGDENVARLRKARDDAKIGLEVMQQQAFRRGADRKDVGRLLDWSMRRELRTDTPPANWPEQDVIGARRAA